MHAPVAQRIEHQPPELGARVRVSPGALPKEVTKDGDANQRDEANGDRKLKEFLQCLRFVGMVVGDRGR